MNKILLCPPTFYNIRYEINPWMDLKNPVDPKKALEQYETLKYAFNELGIDYEEIVPQPDLPDQVFTTDTGHIEKDFFIKANFKYPQRAKEVEIVVSHLQKNGFTFHSMPENIFFEGGDLLKMNERYYFGWGKRSSQEALAYLKKFLNAEVFPIELPDEYFYHLDTCFAPINDKVAIVNKAALTDEGNDLLKKHFVNLIETNEEDNRLLACNLLSIGGQAILTQGISNELKDALRPHVDLINTVPMSEYIKGGGSVHCVSLEICN